MKNFVFMAALSLCSFTLSAQLNSTKSVKRIKMQPPRSVPAPISADAVATNTARTFYNEGNEQYRAANYETGLAKAISSIEAKSSAEAFYLKAICLRKLNKDLALQKDAYEMTVALAPKHTEALTQLGVIALNDQRFADAERYFNRAIEQKPTDAKLQKFLEEAKNPGDTKSAATNNIDNKKGKTAEKEAEVQGESKAFTTAYNEGVTALNAGDSYTAVAAFRKAISLNEQHANAHYCLGKAYTKLHGEENNAIRYLQKAATLDTKNPKPAYELGNVYFLQNNLNKAANNYERAQKLGLHAAILYQQLSACYTEQGQPEGALAWAERGVEAFPTDVTLLFQLGTTLLATKKYARAETIYDRLLGIEPKHKEVRYQLCLVYLEEDKADKSLELAKKIIEDEPDYGKGYWAAALAYERQSNSYLSDKMSTKAQKLDPSLRKK